MRECLYYSLRKSHFLLNPPPPNDCLYCSRPTSIWGLTCSPRAPCFCVAFILKVPQGALAKALSNVRRIWNTTPGLSENLETILWDWRTSGKGPYVSSPAGCKKSLFYAISPWTFPHPKTKEASPFDCKNLRLPTCLSITPFKLPLIFAFTWSKFSIPCKPCWCL